MRCKLAERTVVARPIKAVFLAGGADDALSIHPDALASILLGIFILGIDKGQTGLDRIELIPPDAAIENFETASFRIELPSGLVLRQRDREREVVIADDDDGLLVTLGLDRGFCVIG